MKINQSQTAISVFHSSGFNLITTQPQQKKILEAMMCNPSLDYTIGELSSITGIDKSAVSGRRNAMLSAGLIERGIERKCSKSGKVCETVRLIPDLLRGC